MNITQVYLTPDYETTKNRDFMVKYQNQNNYLKLFIEDCLRGNKHNLGNFNRLVLSEGGDPKRDFKVVGNNALPIALDKTYDELETYTNNRDVHLYFVRKYIEGFKKLDEHFSTSLANYLYPLIERQYEHRFIYEKQMASKKIDGFRIQVLGVYSSESYKLIINVHERNNLIRTDVIYESDPDIFIVKYNIYKVIITDSKILVLNKIKEHTLEYNLNNVI